MPESNQVVDRTRNFRTRVALERDVLAIVNSSPGAPELLGLTAAAIEDWKKRSTTYLADEKCRRVMAILLTIARETGTVTDQSREVLAHDQIRRVSPKLIETLRAALDELAPCDLRS